LDAVSSKPAISAIIRSVGLQVEPRDRLRHVVVYLLLVTAIYQVLLFNFNSDSFFSPIGWLDPFYYMGYGLYYAIPDVMNDYYKVSRLPWNLLQFAARQIFRPDAAAFALQFVSFSGMSVAAYLFFQQVINRSAAFLIAVLCIFFPIAYSNGGADYHNTITGLLYFVMLAWAAASINTGSLLAAVCGGGAIALALHTNPTLVMLGPGIALYMVALWWVRERTLRYALAACACLFIGVLAATAVLALISAGFDRGFMFFQAQVNYIIWAQGKDHNLWPYPLTWQVLLSSKANGYVFGVLVVSAAELIRLGLRRHIKQQLEAAAAYGGYVLTCLIAVALQVKGQPIIEPGYMLYGVVLATFIPVGYLLNTYLCAESSKQLDLFAVGFPIACGGAIFGSAWIYGTFRLTQISPVLLSSGSVLVLYLALTVAQAGRFNVAIVGLLALLNAMLIPYIGSFTRDRCHAHRDLNVFISDASLLATSVAGHPGRVFVFADPEDRMTERCFPNWKTIDVGSSFASIAHQFLGKPYGQQQIDALTREDFANVANARRVIALFAVHDTVKQHLAEKAKTLGFDLATVAMVPQQSSGVVMYLLMPAAQ
jgi:hypothetical protein